MNQLTDLPWTQYEGVCLESVELMPGKCSSRVVINVTGKVLDWQQGTSLAETRQKALEAYAEYLMHPDSEESIEKWYADEKTWLTQHYNKSLMDLDQERQKRLEKLKYGAPILKVDK